MKLERIVTELDPRRDLDIMPKIFPESHSLRSTIDSGLYFMYLGVKHVVRGSVSGVGVGALSGYLVGLFSGSDTAVSTGAGALFGGSVGAAADTVQFLTRFNISYLQRPKDYSKQN